MTIAGTIASVAASSRPWLIPDTVGMSADNGYRNAIGHAAGIRVRASCILRVVYRFGPVQAGHQIIMQVESDPGAQQVLRRHFPGVLLIPDVCGLQSLPPDTELLAAGFPCVDVSRAGLRQGLAGDSSGLVRHVFRLLADSKAKHRPVPWVLLENVEALLDRCQGEEAAAQRIVDTLEFLGYSSWAQRVVCTAGQWPDSTGITGAGGRGRPRADTQP
ncbi:hypothetical protein QJQ45_023803 [Haematococcus lacustris]|nr:hypothetical protein QJQ45_023803 [Haematococcus lacustris]